jgi:hypothetical protein
VPPDFMPSLCLPTELTAQSPEFLSKFRVSHKVLTVTRSSL